MFKLSGQMAACKAAQDTASIHGHPQKIINYVYVTNSHGGNTFKPSSLMVQIRAQGING